MSDKLLTVFTPAYNRGYCLDALYQSLVGQTSDNFLWHIVDDGSSDNTKELVQNWIEENKICIIYEYQKNAGKHAAHNRGVETCSTELFFCVDSDDELTNTAVEEIESQWKLICDGNIDKISGMVMYRAHRDGRLIGTEFPEAIEYDMLSGLYAKGFKGDTALVYRTCVLKNYPFPVFEGERFMRENIVYDQIDKDYKLKVVRKAIYLCEYLEDGLSRNATKLELRSPKGAALFRLGEYRKAHSLKRKIRNCGAYVLYSIIGHNSAEAIKEIGFVKYVAMLPIAMGGYIGYILKGVNK